MFGAPVHPGCSGTDPSASLTFVPAGKLVAALMAGALPLWAVGCSPVKHTSITGILRSTVSVTYTVTTESASSEATSINYTDPLDGSQTTVRARAAWSYTWLQVPAIAGTSLQVRVTGPNPERDTCAIRINGQRVTAETGQPGEASGTPLICTYTLSPANA
jgi:hypothetical protein